MKILIYGAGVIGTVYAAKLYKANYDVTLLARNERFINLKKNKVIVNDILNRKQTVCNVPLIQQLEPTDYYDLIIVTVRYNQIDAIVPILTDNTVCSLILFMFNNPDTVESLINRLAPKHVIIGFPGIGGTYHNNQVDYIQIKQQATIIGEINGIESPLIHSLKSIFEKTGFVIEINNTIVTWLKIHAVFVACLSAAISKENGDSVQLGKNRSSVRIMVKSIREGFTACQSLGLTIVPKNLKIIFLIMPIWVSVFYWQKAMRGQLGTVAIAPHANSAKDEMKLLSKKVLSMVHSSSIVTPTLDNLLSAFVIKK